MFKSGHKPWNIRPVGTELLDGDGYTRIKTKEILRGKKRDQWIPKQRLIYAEHYGEVPENCFVVFADGDKTNFDINNLILVEKKVNAVMNKKGLRFKDAELTKAGHALAKLMIATREKEKHE